MFFSLFFPCGYIGTCVHVLPPTHPPIPTRPTDPQTPNTQHPKTDRTRRPPRALRRDVVGGLRGQPPLPAGVGGGDGPDAERIRVDPSGACVAGVYVVLVYWWVCWWGLCRWGLMDGSTIKKRGTPLPLYTLTHPIDRNLKPQLTHTQPPKTQHVKNSSVNTSSRPCSPSTPWNGTCCGS